MKPPELTYVLLPGLHGTTTLFQPLRQAMPDHIKTVALAYPTHDKQSYEQLVPRVLEAMAQVQGAYVLVGESFGGPLALKVAQARPKGLAGVVLSATFVDAPHWRGWRLLPWQWIFKVLRWIPNELQHSSPEVLADRIQSVFNVNVADLLKTCPAPVMYLAGSRDVVVPGWNRKQIQKIRPDVKVHRFNTGHLVLQCKPAEAWEAIAKEMFSDVQ